MGTVSYGDDESLDDMLKMIMMIIYRFICSLTFDFFFY